MNQFTFSKITLLIIICLLLVIILRAVTLWFNRAPERMIPTGDFIVSPASGKIIGITSVTDPNITFQKQGITNTVSIPQLPEKVTMVIIEMTPADVHVQRAPIGGVVATMDYYDGKHKNALGKSKQELSQTNEKMVTAFRNDQESVGVIQVAGLSARRIRNTITVQDTLEKGQIYGRILLGSQVVVLIPESRTITVSVGDRVVDGETILAK